ncbi:Protein of unknown function [Lactobacillus delbrueckii subsp. bulgaricus]|nr:Protein of unknown function [Lactobacillus delbrueckii subsp. bulgaricus]
MTESIKTPTVAETINDEYLPAAVRP